MDSRDDTHARPFRKLRVTVCSAGCVVGVLFGLLAPWMYWSFLRAGGEGFRDALRVPAGLFGGGGGLVAGAVWSAVIVRKSRTYFARLGTVPWRLLASGVRWGIVVGMGSAAAMHLGLMAVVERWDPAILVGGMVFGAVGGSITGLVCGALARAAAGRALSGHDSLPQDERT
jgi:hypothetical protein